MNVQTIIEPVIAGLILLGAVLGLLSSIGVVRFPDVYTRSHASSKSSTLSILFVLLGAFLYFLVYLEITSVKLLLAIVFVFITSPVAGHVTGRAAYRSGVPLWKRSVRDDLRHVVKPEASQRQSASLEE